MILIKVINKLDKDKVKQIIFDWNDTKDISEEEMRILVIFNDQDNQIKKENIEALTNYGLKSIPWSKKYELLPDVA